MWACYEDDCEFDFCKSCLSKVEVRCSYTHSLEFDVEQFECCFCDSEQYPCMVCKGENCNFRICLECVVSDTKIKDQKGHPCKMN